MSISCPGPSCPMCRGDICRLCSVRGGDFRRCERDHDREQRHALPDEDDALVVDEPAEEPTDDFAERVPTQPLRGTLGGRLEIDLSDASQAAAFLEVVAQILRERRRLVLIVE